MIPVIQVNLSVKQNRHFAGVLPLELQLDYLHCTCCSLLLHRVKLSPALGPTVVELETFLPLLLLLQENRKNLDLIVMANLISFANYQAILTL